jgi:hypothetical protein
VCEGDKLIGVPARVQAGEVMIPLELPPSPDTTHD